MQKIKILYEDEQLIVCHKEAGIATQTSKLGQMDMVSMIANYRKDKGEDSYVGVIHRLDQPVEGVIVFGKNPEASRELSKQVKEREISKQYYAVVDGIVENDRGVLEDYLLKDGKTNTSHIVSEKQNGAKLAKLEYKVLERKEGKSLLLITLFTGRHHQIRVQLANAGYPIYGDKKYGNCAGKMNYMPLGLCSCRLQFEHPLTKETLEYKIEPEGIAFEGYFNR